jgi:hypothetical protein
MSITRSGGIIPRSDDGRIIPTMGPLPGGGYEGRTRRLDQAVRRFAEWLREKFELPVEQRQFSRSGDLGKL